MKKVTSLLALILCVLMLTLSFASCANMDKYKDNLGSDYEIETAEDEEMEAFMKMLDLDAEKYGVEEMVSAYNKEAQISVMIIKCKNTSAAKDLVEEFEKVIEESCEGKAENKGSFVFVGDEDAIKDALGK